MKINKKVLVIKNISREGLGLFEEVLRKEGYEFRNTIIWDRTNIVNGVGIFGWPSNYITMGTTFEYLLHFMKGKE